MKIYIELRACSGGEEAQGFANELMSVYLKYARKNDLKTELVSLGKTIIMLVDGKEKYLTPLLSEDGVHKVQRVSKNKLHTSTVSVAVLPISDTKEVEINNKDISFDTYRGSGAGGQHRNKTDSAVRVTHIPTGTVVCCENERSQLRNKEVAVAVLYSKLKKAEKQRSLEKNNNKRQTQVGMGERAESRRTYNYIRNEIVDNLTGQTCSLKEFMDKANIAVIK